MTPTAKTAKKAPAKRRPAVKKVPSPAAAAAAPKPPTKRTYIFAVGRRKEAVARVRWHQAGTGITVNGRPYEQYFRTVELQKIVRAPLDVSQLGEAGAVTAKVTGGGSQGQAEAVRLGLARALVKMDGDLRLSLKRAGFLRRDPRVKERKKYGLKRARRAPQWQKR